MNHKIVDKLIKMEEYLEELLQYKPINYEDYVNNKMKKYAIERVIQLIIDIALDINNMLIKESGEYPAGDYFESFLKLADLGILDIKFARDIAPSTGIRNRLVYEYEKVNDQIVYDNIDKTYDYYIKYMKEIYKYLND